ncbi:MAG: hypothetical protein HY275_19260 [Gemmatimonadetes bacterium]|nr:hypothetical protein [Gemmatimonadota bacterium]
MSISSRLQSGARAAAVALGAALAGGCYLYRTPPGPQPSIAARVLSRAEAIEDLDTLVAIVREVHPDPGPQLGALRDSLARAWPESVTRAAAWRDLSRVLATMGDGHTSLWLANDEVQAGLSRGLRAFPLGVTRTEAGVVVVAVLGADSARVAVGERLLRVGDQPVEAVVHTLGEAAPAELEAFRDRVVLGSFGPRLWLEGVRPPLDVTVAGADGRERAVRLAGATQEEFARRPAARPREALTVRRTADSVLVIDFTSMGSAPGPLRARLDSAFDAARTEGLRAVVVDLRRNGGGNSQQGTMLLSYVTSKPLVEGIRKEWRASRRYKQRFASGVTPLLRTWFPFSWIDGQLGGLFSVPDGDMATMHMETPEPPPANARRIERPLCVLIGPSTFSSAMMLANTVRLSGVGTLIGEPTGEPPNSHGEVFSFVLPRFGLAGQVSSARFVLDPDTAAAHRGVLPHVPVVRTTADVVAGRDPVLARGLQCGREGEAR